MNKIWTLNSVTRIGLFALLLGLGVMTMASQAEHLALADRFNVLVQIEVNALQNLKALKALALQLPVSKALGTVAYAALIGMVIRLYLTHFRPRSLNQARYLWLLFLLSLLFVGAAWVMVTGHGLLSYLFPTATLSIMLAVLIDAQLSMLVTFLMGLIVGHMAGGSLELTVYTVMGGLIGVLSLGPVKRVNRLLWSGVYIALSNVIVVLIFHLSNSLDPIGLLALMLIGIANGVSAASLTLIGFFLVGNLLGIPTSIQLLELIQPFQPLLRQLVLHAPGTYHHSLMVSNLAEQAAERIGADALLTRVGAYYHDIGKLHHPSFFIENQFHKTNIHGQVDSQTSAQIIINHVKEGLKLAKKYRLPREVQAFIAEHQGTSLVEHFYHQACMQAGNPARTKEADFRYPGPKPQSKETALVMLADSCEAAARATQSVSVEALDQLVDHVIIAKVGSGQLDECDLTLHELGLIQNTFVEMLQGAFHRRTEYQQEMQEEQFADANPPMLHAPSQPPLVIIPSTICRIIS